MSELIKKLNTASKRLEVAASELENLIKARHLLDFKGHQEEARISIGGVSVHINHMDRGYAMRVSRGYEMIHLGAQKIYNGLIDEKSEEVKSIKAEITEIAGQIQKSK